MKYLVINPETYRVLIKQYGGTRYFDTVAGAKRSLNATRKKINKLRDEHIAQFGNDRFDWCNGYTRDLQRLENAVVIDQETFEKNEPVAIKKNFMTGETFAEPLNTPHYASPSSETYWSS